MHQVNPARPDRTQSLGAGGLGRGRFGVLGGDTVFIKKQKFRKNEAVAGRAQGMALYEQVQPSPTGSKLPLVSTSPVAGVLDDRGRPDQPAARCDLAQR